MGAHFSRGGKKPRKTNPTVALSDLSRECPYPAPGLDSVLLITAFLAAERKSLNLFTLGFPQQHFGAAPTLYLHGWKLLSNARDWAAVCIKPWICEHPFWLKIWEKHLSASLEYPELTCCKRPCKDALEPKGCCCKGPKHRTAVPSGSGLVFGCVLLEDLQLSSPLGAELPALAELAGFQENKQALSAGAGSPGLLHKGRRV